MLLVSNPEYARSAVSYHRLEVPFKHIEHISIANIESVVEVNGEQKAVLNLTKEFLKDNNISMLWFSRNISNIILDPNPVFRMCRDLGIKIVMDIDDYWDVGYGHVLHKTIREMNLMHSQISQMKAADYLCVTHKYLADLCIKELGISARRIIIAPNGIDPSEPQYNQEFEYNHDRIFWQGSVTHHYDLRQLAEAINELELKIYIAGYSKKDVLKEGEKLIYKWDETGNMFNKKQWIHQLPVTEYMNTYKGKGICVIPLEKNKFTMCKSNLKLLEAGWAKKPVIVSGIHPYNVLGKDGKNCLYAMTKKGWINAIERLLNDPEFCDDIRFQLHEDVQNFTIDKVNKPRLDVIN